MKKFTLFLVISSFIAFAMDVKILNPNYPVVEGNTNLTKKWSIHLDSKFNKRYDDSSIVLWQPSLTFWISSWESENNNNKINLISHAKSNISKKAKKLKEFDNNTLHYITYRLSEGDKADALYCYIISDSSFLYLGVYFDSESQYYKAIKILKSIKHE